MRDFVKFGYLTSNDFNYSLVHATVFQNIIDFNLISAKKEIEERVGRDVLKKSRKSWLDFQFLKKKEKDEISTFKLNGLKNRSKELIDTLSEDGLEIPYFFNKGR